jgi:hypothetical protein
VVGVDIGLKITAGQATGELAIRVLVREKRDVPLAETVPEFVQGIKTDVIQIGWFTFMQDTTRYDPLVGGGSIGTCGGAPGVGTLGLIVRDLTTGDAMALSNWHVLVAGTTQAVLVTQPGPGDNGRCPGDGIGQVAQSAINEYVDCAVARLFPGVRGLRRYIQDVGGVNGPLRAEVGSRVKKRGRTTGVTLGDVDTIDLTCRVEAAGVQRTFRRQIGVWRADAVSDVLLRPGDSGSALLRAYDNGVVGLLFAGSTGNPFLPDGAYGIANPISSVFETLNIELWRPPKTKEKDKDKDKDKDKENMKEKDVMKEKETDALFGSAQPSLPGFSVLGERGGDLVGPLAKRLARLEATVGELSHFISQAYRPQVNDSMPTENERPKSPDDD